MNVYADLVNRKRARVLRAEPSEQAIQRSILDYLRFKKIMAWKNPTTGVFDPTTRRFRRGVGPVGAADIFGLLPGGRFLAIEVKRPGGRIAPHQASWLAQVHAQGALTLVAYSLADVEKMIGEVSHV